VGKGSKAQGGGGEAIGVGCSPPVLRCSVTCTGKTQGGLHSAYCATEVLAFHTPGDSRQCGHPEVNDSSGIFSFSKK
jgi:hypothetical protein